LGNTSCADDADVHGDVLISCALGHTMNPVFPGKRAKQPGIPNLFGIFDYSRKKVK
jgi:hypothetical protein